MSRSEGAEPSTVDVPDRIKRLERRVERERLARKAAEQIAEDRTRSLYEANRDLDRRIVERTAELDEALTAASRASDAKSAFLAHMSHQLKTPLHSMLGMLELLEPEVADDRLKSWISSCRRSTRRLDRLIDRLIQYGNLEGRDLVDGSPLRPVADVAEAAAERWRDRCLRSGQLLTLEETPGRMALVPAPPELHLVLDELLANVAEHAGHGAVRLFARVAEGRQMDGRSVEIDIYDPGPGIDDTVVGRSHLLSGPENLTTIADDEFDVGLAIVDAAVRGLRGAWTTVHDGTQHGVRVTLPAPEPGPSGSRPPEPF